MAGEVVPYAPNAQPARRAHMLPQNFDEATRMATAIAQSGLFGCKNTAEAFSLMLLADAEGLHPAAAARDYHIIEGRPSLKADAMLARYMSAGGKVEWLERSDTRVAANFTHPASGTVMVEWTIERAKGIKRKGKSLTEGDNWRNYPRQMLAARTISEGVRASFPAVVAGVYTPEEVQDFEPAASVSRPAVAPSPQPLAVEVEHTEAGAGDSTPAAPASFHDQPSNVPGGFKSLKTIEVDEEQRTDHTKDPEWTTLSTELTGNCECRADVLAWWETRKKDLKARKPHFAKAFYQGEVIPFAASFAQTVVYEDEPGGRG